MNYYEPGTPFVKRLDARRPPAHSCAPRPRACAAPRDGRDFPEKSLCRRKVLPSRFYRVHFSAKSFFGSERGAAGGPASASVRAAAEGGPTRRKSFPLNAKPLFQKFSPNSSTDYALRRKVFHLALFGKESEGARRVAPPAHPCAPRPRAAPRVGRVFGQKLSAKSFRANSFRVL